jgi:hypothetical protein
MLTVIYSECQTQANDADCCYAEYRYLDCCYSESHVDKVCCR